MGMCPGYGTVPILLLYYLTPTIQDPTRDPGVLISEHDDALQEQRMGYISMS